MATHALREQEALRRIATLVAQETSQAQVFEAIASEAMQLLGTDALRIVRFDGESGVVIASSGEPTVAPPGFRFPLDAETVAARIFRDGKPARQDDYADLDDPVTEPVRAAGIRSVVGAPVLVEGRLWGAITTGMTREEPLPPDTESRLGEFTALMATAISNADARAEVERLAEEQAALRRVATLVAKGVPSAALFSAVTKEVVHVFSDVDPALVTSVIRFDPGPESVLVGASRPYEHEPLGTRWTPKELYVSTHVLRTQRSARVSESDLDVIGGPDAEVLRLRRFFYQVGSPVMVEGKLWGAMCLNSTQELPPDTEERLENFTELVATAISNAESRESLARLADEQAALRRVATLVAQRTSPQDLFDAVAEEVGRLLLAANVSMGRYETDDSITSMASWSSAGPVFPPGVRWQIKGTNVAWMVLQTARPARIDDFSAATDPIGVAVREAGYKSAVGSPIVVEGNLWGVISAASSEGPMPPDTEARLASFTELVATAIANAESQEARAVLTEEQAALRRVATLVAQGSSPQDLFDAVAEEVGRLLPAAKVSMARYEPDDSVTAMASWSSAGPVLGGRWPIRGTNVAWMVLQTGRSARIDDFSAATDPMGAAAREAGYRSAVGSPIVVEGRLWGVISAASSEGPMPPDTEARLASFTELVATAIANAESQEARAVLTEEQAALRRVATLVARGAPSTEVFEAVATEVGKLLDTDITVVGRYDGDEAATAIGSWSVSGGGVPVGTRSALGGHNVLSIVAETGEPARVDGYAEATGEAADIARRYGWRSSIAAPIVVEGGLWGVMLVATQRPEPFPAGAEKRLAAFTDLVSTAVANAQAHDEVRRFGDEQAALRRIATLVAEGVQPTEVFSAVSREVERVFAMDQATDLATVVRFDPGPEFVLVGAAKSFEGLSVGARWEANDLYVSTRVFRSGRSARVEQADLSLVGGAHAELLRQHELLSQVGSPILVEGRLWGAVTMNTKERLPQDTERRLERFTELVATAIGNAQGRSELAASRRRIVAASDETRRRIERDLHDGTQQRLVSLGLALRAAEATVPRDRPDLQADLSQIAAGLAGAVEDLQELSRGIHPAILSRGGLVPALRTLARRSAVPVELDVSTDVHVPEPLEVAAYFVASEALANATKHAEASHIQLSLAQIEGVLLLEIRDDGVGGADPAQGSGLVGLADRVEALGGSIDIESRPGDGTQIIARIPSELEAETSSGQDL